MDRKEIQYAYTNFKKSRVVILISTKRTFNKKILWMINEDITEW